MPSFCKNTQQFNFQFQLKTCINGMFQLCLTLNNTVYYSPCCVSSCWHYCWLSNLHSHLPSLAPPSQRELRLSDCCSTGRLQQAAPKAPAAENLTVFLGESHYLLCPGVEEVAWSSAHLKDCLGTTPSGSLLTDLCHCPLLVLSFLGQTEGSPT